MCIWMSFFFVFWKILASNWIQLHVKELFGILKTNGFSCDGHAWGLWITISFVNHSCAPSAHYVITQKEDMFFFVFEELVDAELDIETVSKSARASRLEEVEETFPRR